MASSKIVLLVCLMMFISLAASYYPTSSYASHFGAKRQICSIVKVYKCAREDKSMIPPKQNIKRNWCQSRDGFNCEVSYSISHDYPIYYSYHYGVMVNIRRDLTLGMAHESDEIKLCYRYRSDTSMIDAAQAICRQSGLGDASYARNSYVRARQQIYNQFGEFAEKRTWLAHLNCPQFAKSLDDCTYEFLQPGDTCYLLEANCMQARCFDHHNAIYSTRYRRYGQKCISGCSSYYCFQCSSYCAPGRVHTGYVYYDPHFTTLDGDQFSFMGTCTYTLLQTDLVTIEGKYEPCGKDLVTCLRRVTIKIGTTELTLKQKKAGKKVAFLRIKRDNIPITIPYTNNDIAIYEASSEFDTVDIWSGIKVAWDWRSEIIIGLDDKFKGKEPNDFKVKGLFGNFDGNPNNDRMKPNGDLEMDEVKFGESWRVENSECGDSAAHSNLTQEERDKAHPKCDVINQKPFTSCNQTLHRKNSYENCLVDVAKCGKDTDIKDCLCPSLEEYAESCSENGQIIEKWRDSVETCRLPCPTGQVFQTCKESCLSTCHRIHLEKGPSCQSMCVEGCNCPDDKALNKDGKCVDIAECRKEGKEDSD